MGPGRLDRRLALAVIGIACATRPGAVFGRSVVDLAAETGSFKILIRALEVAELRDTLANEGPFTLFAPTDDAFTKIPQSTLDNLMRPENRDRLVLLLRHHVLSGRVISRDFSGRRMEAIPLSGGPVILDARQKPKIGPARIVRTDMPADNGVIHVIDTVLVPESFADDAAAAPGEMLER